MGLYETIAATMPKVTGLRCATCGTIRHPAEALIARYLRTGWPVCCGYTMRMHTEADPLPEKQSGGTNG